MAVERIYRDLASNLKPLHFGAPVAYVYNPHLYAWAPFQRYLELYAQGPKEAVFLGMNPGPWGMAQTGIPFGEISIVRDWLRLEAPIQRPEREHPKRPVLGFACTRTEVSGRRLWGWAKEEFVTPQRFFSRFFIANYCPLAFMEKSGRNFTPDKLPARERLAVEAACDKALRRLVEHLKPERVIGVGDFAEKRARQALAGTDVLIGKILHPSPASPAANRGWAKAARAMLIAQGVAL